MIEFGSETFLTYRSYSVSNPLGINGRYTTCSDWISAEILKKYEIYIELSRSEIFWKKKGADVQS